MARTNIAAMLVFLAACSNADKDETEDPNVTDEDGSFAQDGSDANATDTDAQLVASSLLSSSPGAIGLANLNTSDIGTRDVGDGVKAVYLPRKCVDGKQTAPDTATYTFDNCLGPNGLTNVSGTVTARFVASATSLHLELTYTGMKLNGATLAGTATADIIANGPSRTMTWGADLSGDTARGKPYLYKSSHTVAWTLGEACFTLEGTTQGQVRKRDIKTEVQNFKRCRRDCPEPGGKIIVTNVAKNKVVTIDFDGSNTARYTAPNGKEFALPLVCKE